MMYDMECIIPLFVARHLEVPSVVSIRKCVYK